MASEFDGVLSLGPFIGMNDIKSLAAADAQRASYIENMYAPAGLYNGDLSSRIGVTRIGFTRTLTVTRVSCGEWTLTGAVTATSGSDAVTGVGTLFLTELAVGEFIGASSGGIWYRVTAIASNTALTATAFGYSAAPTFTGRSSATSTTNATAFLAPLTTLVAIGDLITIQGTTSYVSVVTNDVGTTLTGGTWTMGWTNNTTVAVVDAGLTGGQIFHVAQSTLTTGTQRSFLIVSTTSSAIAGAGAGKYRMLDGSLRLRLVQYDHATGKTTDRTSVSMDGVLLSTTLRIYSITFANYFVWTDGVNRPRKVDSSYVITNLTDMAVAAYGPVTQYYGKMFFLLNSDRATEVWSDESDPDTGYGTGTSDNSWQLRQTSSDQIESQIGTNDALYVFRQNSIAIITGAANSDFRSSGTVDAIQNIGTRSPDGLTLVESSVVFADQYMRPARVAPGYGYLQMWKRLQETVRPIGQTAALGRAVWVRYDPTMALVKYAFRWTSSATSNLQELVFDAETWECLGVHKIPDGVNSATGIDHAYAALWLDENIKSRFTIASGTAADCAFYIQKTDTDQGAAATDTLSAGASTVGVIVEGPKAMGDPKQQKKFNRLIVETRNVGGGAAGQTAWKAQWRNSGVDYATARAMPVATNTQTDGTSVKADLEGIQAQGRYLQVKLTNDVTGNPLTRATFDTLTIVAEQADDDRLRA